MGNEGSGVGKMWTKWIIVVT